MKKIYLNILGFKNFESDELKPILDGLEKIEFDYNSILREPFSQLKFKIRRELDKRKNSKFVLVEFESFWSGYTSGQRKLVGRFYRKLDRDLAEKLPKYFEHQFTDNTSNAWSVKIVDVRGKDEGSYSGQIDEFLSKHRGGI